MIKVRLIKLLEHAKKYVVFQVLLQWISLWAQVLMIWCIANLIESAFKQSISIDMILFYGVLILCSIFIRYGLDRLVSTSSYKASVDVKRILRGKIYDKLLKLGTSYKDNAATSEIVQLASEGVEQLEIYFGKYLSQFFYSLLAPLTLFAILSFVNLKASVVLLICVPLIPMSIVVVMKIAKRLLNKYWGLYAELGDSFLENLQGLTTTKIYQSDQKKADEMDIESQKFRHVTMKVLTMQLNSTSVMDIMAYGGSAVGMIFTLSELLKGNVTLSGAVMIILLASEFFIPLRLLGSFFHIAMNGMAASDKIFRLLDLEEVEEKTEHVTDSRVCIKFTDVSFAYEEDRKILDKINMTFNPASITSIAGTSGCGKSTIAGIIMGRNKNYTGSITVNGCELRDINEKSLMENITLVTHNNYLFKGTVMDNLLMGKGTASEEEMINVLKKVNLWGFLESQDGLNTKIAEHGSNFSGGQCQRLALARALLHDSPVYIFDEATSNIDVESEEMIMEVIHELSKTKTIILVSHRLANVIKSTNIYMLDNGRILQSGDHAYLIETEGAYKMIFEKQKELENYSLSKEEY